MSVEAIILDQSKNNTVVDTGVGGSGRGFRSLLLPGLDLLCRRGAILLRLLLVEEVLTPFIARRRFRMAMYAKLSTRKNKECA